MILARWHDNCYLFIPFNRRVCGLSYHLPNKPLDNGSQGRTMAVLAATKPFFITTRGTNKIMTLQELITRRLAVNEEQIESLEKILFLNLRKKDKLIVRGILKGMGLYSLFDGTEFAREIEVLPFSVTWTASAYKGNKLKEIQKILLGKK